MSLNISTIEFIIIKFDSKYLQIMENKIKISSIVLAKNEEDNIFNCIQSQLDCVDDIFVLVDEASTDKTLEIVKSFPSVRFEIIKWEGFSATKQKALQKTKYDWVLWIDADEVIRPELVEEINALKKTGMEYDSYSVARRAYFLGRWIKHSGWYPARVDRLFNKTKIQFAEKNVHEYLQINAKSGNLKNDLDHFTDKNIEHYYNKFNTYTSLAAKELFLKKKNFSLFELLLRPFLLFVKMYFLRLGFLDGFQGFVLAIFSANYVFTKYSKLWEQYQKERL